VPTIWVVSIAVEAISLWILTSAFGNMSPTLVSAPSLPSWIRTVFLERTHYAGP
jgi:hypothetical protein